MTGLTGSARVGKEPRHLGQRAGGLEPAEHADGLAPDIGMHIGQQGARRRSKQLLGRRDGETVRDEGACNVADDAAQGPS